MKGFTTPSPVVAAARWAWTSIVVTGGALLACVVLAPEAGSSPDVGLAWLLFLGSSVHVASTGWFFTNAHVRSYAWNRHGRYVWAPLGLVATGIGLSVAASPRLMAWAVLLLLAWQLHHFQKQNLGQIALTATSFGLAPLRRGERVAIGTAGAAAAAEVCAHPALLQLHVQPPLGRCLASVATALLVVGVVAGTVALIRRRRSDRPPTFCAMYVLAFLFPLPVFVFTSPYAAVAGLTTAHGLQYLLLVGLVAAGDERRRRVGAVATLCATAVLGGVLLNLLSHLHGDDAPLRLLFGVYLSLLAAHFVVDAGVWRLRDPFVRTFLSQRVGYLVGSAPWPGALMSVADRSATDIECGCGSTVAAAGNPE